MRLAGSTILFQNAKEVASYWCALNRHRHMLENGSTDALHIERGIPSFYRNAWARCKVELLSCAPILFWSRHGSVPHKALLLLNTVSETLLTPGSPRPTLVNSNQSAWRKFLTVTRSEGFFFLKLPCFRYGPPFRQRPSGIIERSLIIYVGKPTFLVQGRNIPPS